MDHLLLMNTRLHSYLLLFLLAVAPIAFQAQNVFARKNLTSISIDKFGEEEILLLKQNFESKNLTSAEALRDLSKKAMSQAELRKLKVRLTQTYNWNHWYDPAGTGSPMRDNGYNLKSLNVFTGVTLLL